MNPIKSVVPQPSSVKPAPIAPCIWKSPDYEIEGDKRTKKIPCCVFFVEKDNDGETNMFSGAVVLEEGYEVIQEESGEDGENCGGKGHCSCWWGKEKSEPAG